MNLLRISRVRSSQEPANATIVGAGANTRLADDGRDMRIAPDQNAAHDARTANEPGRSVQMRRVLAIASGGGHWVQLMRLVPAFGGHDLAFVTTLRSHRAQAGAARFYLVADGNKRTPLRLVRMALKLIWIVLRERPDVVISTGAACGYVGVRLARLAGARTVWVDSIANAEHLSLSGRRAGRHTDLWLTQWPHLARPHGPHFRGSVL
jgi:hypothetical protein